MALDIELEELRIQRGVTRDEFWQLKKEMQEKHAEFETADKLRKDFEGERRWYIGVIISLVALAAGSIGALISCALS